MRVIRMAFAGSMALFFLLAAPAIAAQAIAGPQPGPAVQTYQQARTAYSYASAGGGGNPNEQVPEFMGEGAAGLLIVIIGGYAVNARKERLDKRGDLLSQLELALIDFQQQSGTMRLNLTKGYKINDGAWPSLNSAKARVDATADAVLDSANRPGSLTPLDVRARDREDRHARLAKESTTETLKELENLKKQSAG